MPMTAGIAKALYLICTVVWYVIRYPHERRAWRSPLRRTARSARDRLGGGAAGVGVGGLSPGFVSPPIPPPAGRPPLSPPPLRRPLGVSAPGSADSPPPP